MDLEADSNKALAEKIFGWMREPKYQKVWEALIFIYKRPYWKRLWIIQELLANPVTVMHIGLRVLPFDALMVIGHLVRKNISDNPGNPTPLE
jgi:hypothetical protein